MRKRYKASAGASTSLDDSNASSQDFSVGLSSAPTSDQDSTSRRMKYLDDATMCTTDLTMISDSPDSVWMVPSSPLQNDHVSVDSASWTPFSRPLPSSANNDYAAFPPTSKNSFVTALLTSSPARKKMRNGKFLSTLVTSRDGSNPKSVDTSSISGPKFLLIPTLEPDQVATPPSNKKLERSPARCVSAKKRTEYCRFILNNEPCKFGALCNFAHSEDELQLKTLYERHDAGLLNKYTLRTRPCFDFISTGSWYVCVCVCVCVCVVV